MSQSVLLDYGGGISTIDAVVAVVGNGVVENDWVKWVGADTIDAAFIVGDCIAGDSGGGIKSAPDGKGGIVLDGIIRDGRRGIEAVDAKEALSYNEAING